MSIQTCDDVGWCQLTFLVRNSSSTSFTTSPWESVVIKLFWRGVCQLPWWSCQEDSRVWVLVWVWVLVLVTSGTYMVGFFTNIGKINIIIIIMRMYTWNSDGWQQILNTVRHHICDIPNLSVLYLFFW